MTATDDPRHLASPSKGSSQDNPRLPAVPSTDTDALITDRDDAPTDEHPGAAFGIPAGATDEDVFDAVFGDGVVREDLPALRAELAARHDGRVLDADGIDPDLLPYVEAAQDDDLVSADGTLSLAQVREAGRTRTEQQAAQDAEDRQALRELVAHNMLALGQDVDRLDELDALLAEIDADDSDEWESWPSVLAADDADAAGLADARTAVPRDDDGGADDTDTDAHIADLQAAARAVDIASRMREVEALILQRAPEHAVQPSLERVEAVLDILGHPQRNYRVIHITGTNGKTSTARMTERLLAATGLRTGRFTSPHLASIRERICLDGEPISAEGFIAAWEDVAPYIAMVDERSQAAGGPRLSFFEVLTVMALAVFADYPVDVAVVEVGMGGTWDSTNVVDSEVEIITPIGHDHSRWLGDSIEEIASNKAGIIKDGATLITAAQPEAARAVIAEAAARHQVIWRRELADDESIEDLDATHGNGGALAGAPNATGLLRVVDRTLAVGGQLLTLVTPAATYEDVFLPLHGHYQAHNALLALAAVEAMFAGRPLPATIVENGFASVTSPGRLEVLRSSPTVLVDAGHNPHGVAAVTEAIEEAFTLRRLVAVVGAMADKDVEGILSVLEPIAEAVVAVPIDSERAMDPEDVAEIAREVYGEDRVHVADDLGAGVEQAVTLAESPDVPMTSCGVLIIGSVVLAAQARALFQRH